MEKTFGRRTGHFEFKDQISPNALIFDNELTDSGYRLLLCLNAFPESWIAVQSDICKRLNWGKEKMENAVKNCCNLGYMKVTQHRTELGKFSQNHFEYDLYRSYLKKDEGHEKLKECLPKGGDPPTVDPPSVNPPLTNNKENIPYLENKQITGVVSDEKLKREVFNKFKVNAKTTKILLSFEIQRIKDAVEAYEQWLEKNDRPPCDDPMLLALARRAATKNENGLDSKLKYILSIKYLDGKVINGINISIGLNYVCFGAKTFGIQDKNFIEDIEKYIEELKRNKK